MASLLPLSPSLSAMASLLPLSPSLCFDLIRPTTPRHRSHLSSFLTASPTLRAATSLSASPFPVHALLDNNVTHLPLAQLNPMAVGLVINLLGPILSFLNLLFIVRIVMTWYPQLPVNKFPYFLAYVPTEPVLAPTRRLIRPVGGVDISPIVWVAVVSFLNEILLGNQGILILLSQQQQP